MKIGTCSLSKLLNFDTQVARRGRQYHSQPTALQKPSYKKQNRLQKQIVYKKQKLLQKIKKKANRKKKKQKINK